MKISMEKNRRCYQNELAILGIRVMNFFLHFHSFLSILIIKWIMESIDEQNHFRIENGMFTFNFIAIKLKKNHHQQPQTILFSQNRQTHWEMYCSGLLLLDYNHYFTIKN